MEEERTAQATGGVVRLVTAALDKAIGLPADTIARNVDRLRRRHTSGGDRHVIRALEVSTLRPSRRQARARARPRPHRELAPAWL